MGNHIIPERLTWKQMQEKYPDQWLGLTDVKYLDDDGVTIESGVIKYADKTHSELLEMVIDDKIANDKVQLTLWAINRMEE